MIMLLQLHLPPHPPKLLKNSRNALHLAAYRGHLPVLQYLCPKFGDRVLDRDGNGENCLDIAHRLERKDITEFLKDNYPQLERKVWLEEGIEVSYMRINVCGTYIFQLPLV